MSTALRSPIAITFFVWRAIFLREALDRLFRERAAWFWLLIEPVLHIAFLAILWTVIRLRTMGGIDVVVWLSVGLLSFFFFRRTAMQTMYGVDCSRPLFVYRQVKPIDPTVVRAALEGFLMVLVSAIVLVGLALLGHMVWRPDDPLMIFVATFGLWLFGLGFGLITSVLIMLVQELEHIFKIVMLPLYLISGVIWPLASIPPKYRELLLINPVAHGLEAVRLGFSHAYHAVPELSLPYLYGAAVVFIFVGLLLHRAYALRLVMQ
ncbi:ABC transporter permease [Desulfosarcina sp. OttesenSCG-928-A07]|nr:ABC transporter permease [Desulfosarcina sp. OttesenSCG-928-G17]MDL2330190.1 ABC transporter permease [Desulfosarcina sp. OttesenSCG-928-A07]